jgi:hypothetical protein
MRMVSTAAIAAVLLLGSFGRGGANEFDTGAPPPGIGAPGGVAPGPVLDPGLISPWGHGGAPLSPYRPVVWILPPKETAHLVRVRLANLGILPAPAHFPPAPPRELAPPPIPETPKKEPKKEGETPPPEGENPAPMKPAE